MGLINELWHDGVQTVYVFAAGTSAAELNGPQHEFNVAFTSTETVLTLRDADGPDPLCRFKQR